MILINLKKYISSLIFVKYCLVFIAFFSFKVSAQQAYSSKDSIYTDGLLQKVQYYINQSQFDSALKIAEDCLSFCESVNYQRGKGYAHLKIADISYHLTDLNKMAANDSALLQVALLLKDSIQIASAYNHLGLYFSETGNKQKAERLLEHALLIVKNNPDATLNAEIYNNLGNLYGLMGDMDKATDANFKSLRLYESINDKYGEAIVYDNLASLFFSLKQYEKAINYQQKSIAIRTNSNDHYALAIAYSNLSQMYSSIDSLDEAFRYQDLGMKNANTSGSKKLIAQSHIALSLLYSAKQNKQQSLEEELKAIALLEEIGEESMLSRRYIAAGIGYSTIDSLKALYYFNKAIALSAELKNKENLRDAYGYLNVFFRERKDFYNAYYNYRKYISYRDSVINEETLTRIADIQAKYETEKKDDRINQLNNEQAIQQLELEKQKAIIHGNLLESREKEAQINLLEQTKELSDLRIKRQSEDLNKQTVLAQVNEQKRRLAEQEQQLNEKQLQNQRLIRNIMIGGIIFLLLAGWVLFNRYGLKKQLEQKNILLNERSRISSELHDEVGSTLSSINILSHAAKNKIHSDANKSSEMLEKIKNNSQQMMDAISDIVWSINPNNDSLQSLVVRMKEFSAEILESKNIAFDFLVECGFSQIRLSPEKRRDIYLVFKEAVNNIAKYSGAENARINIKQNLDCISMLISDDGCGFDAENQGMGNGITNMRNRILKHNGSFSLETKQGVGTAIQLSLPIA